MKIRGLFCILAVVASIILMCCLSSCGQDTSKTGVTGASDAAGDASTTPTPLQPKAEGLWLQVEDDTATISVFDGKETTPRLRFLAGAQTGLGVRTSQPKVQFAYGSFKFDDTGEPAWQGVVRLKRTAASLDSLQYDGLDASGATIAQVTLTLTGPQSFRLQCKPTSATNRATVAYETPEDEHFLGLGGQSFDVDHRGHRVALWVEEDGIGKFPEAESPVVWMINGKRHQTHTPMPIYHSSRGQAVILQSDHRVIVDLAKTEPKVVRWEDQGGSIDLTLHVGDNPLNVQRAIAKHVGTPEVLPAFALLPWVDAIYGSDNVRRVAKKLRDLQVPVTVVWSEDWRGGNMSDGNYTLDEDWQADAKLYPDLKQLSQDLHGLGYKFLTYNNTFITDDADIAAEAETKGYGIRKADGSQYKFNSAKFVPATMLDLWNPAARKWAQDIYATGLQAGADGWMADFCEWLPTDAFMADGSSGWDRHQQYAVECQKLNRELFNQAAWKDGVERLFFVRSAWLGSQPLVSVVWAGDQQTDFSEGDGLPSTIPMGIGLGVTGFPYYGSDIAGYASTGADPTTKELFFRWTTVGALSPIMRTHHGKYAGLTWQWEHDLETEAHFALWSRRHAQLFPYLWSLAQDPALPMMRPLALHYPTFAAGWTIKDTYMLGDRIVVAPIVQEGKTSRALQLPAGTWYSLYGNQKVKGGSTPGPAERENQAPGDGAPLPVEVSLTQIAAFVPAGTLLPMLPEGTEMQWAQAVAQSPATLAWQKAAPGVALHVWPGGPKNYAGQAVTPSNGVHHIAYTLGNGDGTPKADYAWYGGDWDGTCKSATWNGKDAPVVDGAVEVTGIGTLLIDGTGRLDVLAANLDTAKRIRVVCRGK